MMKILIIINTIIPFLACIQVLRSLFISLHLKTYLEVHSLQYQITDDKKLFEKTGRFFITLTFLSNFLWFLWNLSRWGGYNVQWNAFEKEHIKAWIPYSSIFIAATSILFSLILFSKAHILLTMLKGHGLKILKNIDFII